MTTETTEIATQEKIQEMVRRIVARFRPEKIILIGSYARGTAGPDSEVDLLVVKHLTRSKRQEQLDIRLALHGLGLAKDFVLPPSRFTTGAEDG